MTARLFYSPGTCSLGSMAALSLADIAFEPVKVDLGGDRAELRSVNPNGKVATLAVDGDFLTETIAIVHWADSIRPGELLLPTSAFDRSRALAMLSWLGSTLHLVRRQFARPAMFADDEGARRAIREAAVTPYRDGLDQLEGMVDDRAFTLGVQAHALTFLQWARLDNQDLGKRPKLTAMGEKLQGHPRVARAVELHALPFPPQGARSDGLNV